MIFARFLFSRAVVGESEIFACIYLGKILKFLYTPNILQQKTCGILKRSRNLVLNIESCRSLSKAKSEITLD
jgi:hypothetical protein